LGQSIQRRSALLDWTRLLLVILFALSLVPPARGQNDQISALAASMADSIAHSKNKTILVFDFSGSDRRLGPLGKVLADDFSAALAAANPGFQLQDRSRLKKMIADNELEPENIDDTGIAIWLAADLGAKVFVVGKLDRDGDSLNLSVSSFSVDDGKGIALFKLAFPLTDETKALIPETVDQESLAKLINPDEKCISGNAVPCGGANGYSSPKCLHCTVPAYSPEALAKKVDGVVVLVAVINESGKAEDIRVLKAFPYGLTLRAIHGVLVWTFRPATGPDGKPAKVRQVIDVSFHQN
jgi:Gram-negative bacterial TonB protein C-terminal